MSRYRLTPTAAQRAVLQDHCAYARFVWNMAVEQQSHWHPGKKIAPGYPEQCRQLTEARAEHEWLRQGSVIVQQQALRGFAHAMANFFARTHHRPTWRKMGRNEGFRIVAIKPGHVRKNWAEVTSTRLARRSDVIRVRNVRRKAGLNRGILTSAWGQLVRRLEDKAPGRVEKVNPAFTSQRCSACGHIAADSRESQALFRCVACGYACNADVNAAKNIVNREPQRLVS